MTREDAAFFGCEQEVAHARDIVAEGTSADRQLAVYETGRRRRRLGREALKAVVDHLIAETLEGCGNDPAERPMARGGPMRAEAARP